MLKKIIYLFFFILLLLLICAAFFMAQFIPEAKANQYDKKIIEVKLTKVIDGDTFHGLYQGIPVKIRLYGIDAPEKKQAGGVSAHESLSKMLNTVIYTEIFDVDRYGRLVGIIHLGQGETAQAKLLTSGHAWLSPKYCKINLCTYWEDIENSAKVEKIGVWQEANPVPPWKFRGNGQ